MNETNSKSSASSQESTPLLSGKTSPESEKSKIPNKEINAAEISKEPKEKVEDPKPKPEEASDPEKPNRNLFAFTTSLLFFFRFN